MHSVVQVGCAHWSTCHVTHASLQHCLCRQPQEHCSSTTLLSQCMTPCLTATEVGPCTNPVLAFRSNSTGQPTAMDELRSTGMSAGYQAGGIAAVGSTSLLVNFTVFRHNNGSQVQSCALKARIQHVMTSYAAVASKSLLGVPWGALSGKLQISAITEHHRLNNPAVYACALEDATGCSGHFLCLCAAPGAGHRACHHRCCDAQARSCHSDYCHNTCNLTCRSCWRIACRAGPSAYRPRGS